VVGGLVTRGGGSGGSGSRVWQNDAGKSQGRLRRWRVERWVGHRRTGPVEVALVRVRSSEGNRGGRGCTVERRSWCPSSERGNWKRRVTTFVEFDGGGLIVWGSEVRVEERDRAKEWELSPGEAKASIFRSSSPYAKSMSSGWHRFDGVCRRTEFRIPDVSEGFHKFQKSD